MHSTDTSDSSDSHDGKDQIISNSGKKNAHETEKVTWVHDHTLALIGSMEVHLEDMHHPLKRKNMWEVISNELESQQIHFTASACKKKWQNLIRTYRSVKKLKTKSGWGPTKFYYFDRMDNLLGDKTNNCSPHPIDVFTITDATDTNDSHDEKYQIISNSGERNAHVTEKVTWVHNHTLALIGSMEAHLEDMHHPLKRKNMWEVVSNELESQQIHFSASACKKKWHNLVRTYRSVKKLKTKSAFGSTKFYYFDRMDDLLGDKTNNCSLNTIEVLTIMGENTERDSVEEQSEFPEENKRKRKSTVQAELAIEKKNYYQLKQKTLKIMTEFECKKIALKEERNNLLRQKNELEKRRVEALEAIARK